MTKILAVANKVRIGGNLTDSVRVNILEFVINRTQIKVGGDIQVYCDAICVTAKGELVHISTENLIITDKGLLPK